MQSETQNGIKISTRKIGFEYEKIALNYLLKKGYIILGKNIYTRFGEIDILAKKDNNIYIFEVKGGKSWDGIIDRFSYKKLKRLRQLSELVSLKYDSENVFIDGILIVTMEGTILVFHIKNILQQGC